MMTRSAPPSAGPCAAHCRDNHFEKEVRPLPVLGGPNRALYTPATNSDIATPIRGNSHHRFRGNRLTSKDGFALCGRGPAPDLPLPGIAQFALAFNARYSAKGIAAFHARPSTNRKTIAGLGAFRDAAREYSSAYQIAIGLKEQEDQSH